MPQVFQAVVNDIFRDFLNRFIFVYLDDVLIYWKLEEHQAHVHAPPWKRILCQSLKLWISLTVCVFSGLHPGRRAGEGRSGQSPSGQGMANSHITETYSTVLGVCQFLQMVYTQLQPGSLTLNMPHVHQCSIVPFFLVASPLYREIMMWATISS